MVINIFEDLRAKSDPPESLRKHIENALRQVLMLKTTFDELSDEITYSAIRNESNRNEFFKSLAKAVILHDFGKIDYKFQGQLFKKDENERFQKIKDFFGSAKNIHYQRHEVLSAIWSSLILDDVNGWNPFVITAILYHHYNRYFTDPNEFEFSEFICDDVANLMGYFEFVVEKLEIFKESYAHLLSVLKNNENLQDNLLQSAIKELEKFNWDCIEEAIQKIEDDDLTNFTPFFKVPNSLGKKSFNEDFLKFMLLLGALRRTDYAASGDVEIERQINELPDFEKASKIIKEKLNVHDLWQEDILIDKNPDDLKRAILIAPTGSGKTEFSILWSSKFPKKFLYTLPLRVALNDLYHRFKGVKEDGHEEKGYFSKEMGFSDDLADILHSTSFIEYLKEKEEVGRYTDIETKVNSTKLLSSPVLLTTPDQIFLTSLNYYGSDKVIAVYPMANIVIDEIQTYNPEMAAIIIRTLQLVKAYGGNILIMTATFPPYFKKFLENFHEIDMSRESDLEIKNLKLKRHKIKVVKDLMFEYKEAPILGDEAFEKIKNWLKDHPITLIVVNNVKKAIELYEKLKNDPDLSYKICKNEKNNELFLLHSRIVEKYKSERIEAIKERLRNNQKVVVVSTQIIEASVDFDFDSMITEISTIDSQIQRWGRVYRRRKDDYEGAPNTLIFVGEKDNDSIKLDKGTLFIYDRDVLWATREVLIKAAESGEVLDYAKEKKMVDETFEKEIAGRTLKEKYEEKIEKTLEFLNYFTASKKSNAQRIFRKLAGINVVVPALMKEDKENWAREFAKIVESSEDLPWDKISNQIEKKTGVKKDKWAFKQKLYEYSVSFPVFYGNYRQYLKGEFKGFFVFSKDTLEIDRLKELGLDGILNNLESEYEENEFI